MRRWSASQAHDHVRHAIGQAGAGGGFILSDSLGEIPLQVGPDVLDIRKLYGQTGMFTYDPGFTSTASCESALTFIDGEEGVLLHRGYPIGQLAEHSNFMEVAYLLLNGELPSKDVLAGFEGTITRHTMLHEQLATFYRGFRRDAHPMRMRARPPQHEHPDHEDQRRIAGIRLGQKRRRLPAGGIK